MDNVQTGELICPVPSTVEDAHVLSAIVSQTVKLSCFSPHAVIVGWESGGWQKQLENLWESYIAPYDKERIIVHWTKYRLKG